MTSPNKLRDKVGVKGDQSGQTANGRVRLYVIGQGALSAAAAANTKHDIAKAEHWNLPIILIVLLAVFGSLAAAAIPLALGICTVDRDHGPGLSCCRHSPRCRCSSPRRCRCSASRLPSTIRCSS